ncbi:FAD-dependent oxidoreductase [Coraliomargarita sp. SDUM461003]|uniref:FAD-dependent oxidoreductase n=1 Tax=Thalassobacterium maritimum TaxID=3041265 RepID=A0ABU1AXL2_9BACT|nr:FAD-dependent oxidoreductase [Coraliomargarita sp. SDUM461003]MDQ8208870.1 FAD-dependent oxidoreductase [Coraliomargarita sp. SDUM461003]
MQNETIHESARNIPVVGEYDLCVLGGSCTGVFAAIRAARLGLSVTIVERMGCFGGVATLSLVNVWHSPYDEVFAKQIFAGLSIETMDRLKLRQAVTEYKANPNLAWAFNSAELQIELDEMIHENQITPWLHTSFVAPHIEEGHLSSIIVENKSGRSALKARFFIDATGDGDLCQRLGLETYRGAHRQPSTTCALFAGWNHLSAINWQKLLLDHGEEFGLPQGFCWASAVPDSDLQMLAGTRVYQDCSDARGFTQAEIEGRRQVRAIHDLLRKYAPDAPITLQSLPARIGIRETRHVRCHYQLTGEDVLSGRAFPDAIANGAYRVDIHHDDKPGITFRYLNGEESYSRPGHPKEFGRWRPVSEVNPTYYQIPYRSLIPQGAFGNLLAAGRFIDADEQAHAAIRVMVNMNQTGEAAGTAAWLALKHGQKAVDVDASSLRTVLQENGSIML